MTRDCSTIHPRIGLGDLKFGASRKEVRAYLGEPEAIDDSDMPGGWLRWEYPAIGIYADFDDDLALRLISLTIENPNATLRGHKLIGLDSNAALQTAAGLELGPYKRAEDALGWEAEFHDASLEFRFDDDRLWLISWRVIIDEDDVVHWPE